MSKKILQINVRFNVSAEDLAREFKTAAVPIAGVPGLKWKIFGLDREQSEACGFYLFDDEASLKAYIEGPIMARMKTLEAFSEITLKQFDCVEEASAITRGPV
ncbi:MAG: hypothetical protein AVO34_00910 [Firmicutes bacterium ML8_F2]|jgi:hypothetical protein|nr:MAG: hypothetical protein AVO34_00910 [Firmicutes bacterium ML8_F2]